MDFKRLLLVLLISLSYCGVKAQNTTSQNDTLTYVQLTGIVVSDSMKRLPFTAVFDTHTKRGVIADYYGYFAFVVHPGDTLQFSFSNLEIDNDAIERAKSRLSPQEMAFVYSSLGSDASLAYKYQSYQVLNQVYYKNQMTPNNLLNPVAWSKFLKSVNDGSLKIMK